MQSAIGLGDTSDAANPILDLWVQIPLVVDDGSGAVLSQLAPPVSGTWAIAATASDSEVRAPVVVATGTLDLVADACTEPGHYAATTSPSGWSLPPNVTAAQSGRYVITWSLVLTGAGFAQSTTAPFILFDGATLQGTVDGGNPWAVTFSAVDFSSIAVASSSEVVAALNAAFAGQSIPAVASLCQGGAIISSKTTGTASSVLVTGGTAAAPLLFTSTNGSAPTRATVRREFDLLVGGAPAGLCLGAYCLVSDLREEGVTRDDASDVRLLRAILFASKFIERTTGRFFEPRYQAQTLDGSGGRAMQLGDPLIALQSMTLGNPVQSTIGLGSLRLFNRWLTQRLTNPDDRDDPKVEFVHFKDIFGRQRSASVDSPLFGVPFRDLYFPQAVQNVNVTGLFGYTDWDGSPSGGTPELIRHACKLIVMREFRQLADDLREDRKRHRIVSEKTRDQSYVLDKLVEGPYTGDREIDDLLLAFRRPMLLGGA